MDECVLRKRLRGTSVGCDGNRCALWAQVGPEGSEPRCAIQYFQLLDAPGQELAEWLMSLKDEQLVEALGLRRIPGRK